MGFEEQIAVRRERARTEQVKIRAKPARRQLWGDYAILSASGNTYRVAMRGPGLFQNYCSCPDFAANTLGTCKHVEALLRQLREEHPTLDSLAYRRTRPSLSLHYGDSIHVRLRLPSRPPPELADLARRYCDAAGLLRPSFYPRFAEIVRELRAADETATIYSDVLEFIDRENELAQSLELERSLVARVDAGELTWGRAAIFAACRGRVILPAGATAEAIAGAVLLRHLRGIERVLVISPAAAKERWRKEFAALAGLRTTVASYEAVRKDETAMQDLHPELIILDEAGRMRNRNSGTARAVKHVKSRYAFVLADLAPEDSPEEIYSVVEYVDPRCLGPAFRFLQERLRGPAEIARQLASILFRESEK